MRSFLRLCLFSLLASAVAHSALALDVVETAPPQKIVDNRLTIGGRTLNLPDGNWNFIAQKKGSVTTGIDVIGTHYTAYAMNTKDGEFRSAVQLQLPVSSARIAGWLPEPCKKNDGALFADDFNSGFKTPECLTVHKNASYLSRADANFYSQARQWTTKEKIKLPSAVYEIGFTKYSINEFGSVRIWIPAKNFPGDAAAIAWAQEVPGKLRRFLEKRDNEAALLPFPIDTEKTALPEKTSIPLPASHSSPVPLPTQFAALSDAAAVPRISVKGKVLYQEWLAKPFPRAVAISDKGAIARAYGSDAMENAIRNCEKYNNPCRLYAVDDLVVWTKP